MPQLLHSAIGASYFRSISNYNLLTTHFNVVLFFHFFYKNAINYHTQFLPQQMVYNPKYALVYPPVSLFTGVFIHTYIIYNESVLLFFKSIFCVI